MGCLNRLRACWTYVCPCKSLGVCCSELTWCDYLTTGRELIVGFNSRIRDCTNANSLTWMSLDQWAPAVSGQFGLELDRRTVQCGKARICQSFSPWNHIFSLFPNLYMFTQGTHLAWISALHALLSAARPWVLSRTPRSSTHGNPRPWFQWLGQATKTCGLWCMYVCMYVCM